jgi:hypothetical protein
MAITLAWAAKGGTRRDGAMRQSTAPFVLPRFQLVCVRPRLVAIRRAGRRRQVTMAAVVDRSRAAPSGATRLSLVIPRAALAGALACLDRVAAGLAAAGVSANAITIGSLGMAACAGVLLGFGKLGPAVGLMAVSSLGDALDGLVARRSRTASPAGALLDAPRPASCAWPSRRSSARSW